MTIPEPSLVVDPADIAAHWGIPLDGALEPIPAQTNTVARAGRYVVRGERRSIESVAWEHDLLRFLAAEIPEVAAPLAARDGTTFAVRDGLIVTVLPYVDGERMDGSAAAARTELPAVLARMHRRAVAWPGARDRPDQPSFRRLDWEANPWWDVRLLDLSAVVAAALERCREWVASEPGLIVGPIHGDLHPGNVLMRDGRVAAVLDWSFARLDWPAFDLACAVGVLSLDRDGSIDPAVARQVVETYAAGGGPGEPGALEPLLRIVFVAASLFSLTLAARGRGSNPRFVGLMERALERLG